MTEKSYQENFWGSLNHSLAPLFKIVKLLSLNTDVRLIYRYGIKWNL